LLPSSRLPAVSAYAIPTLESSFTIAELPAETFCILILFVDQNSLGEKYFYLDKISKLLARRSGLNVIPHGAYPEGR
jgi:hypothetical protein